jgi:hypothetical protein
VQVSDKQHPCRVRDKEQYFDLPMALGTFSWVSFMGISWGSILYFVWRLL